MKKLTSTIALLGAVAFLVPPEALCAKILSVTFAASKSHRIVIEPLYQALAERGHDVTVITPIPNSNKPTYREIVTMDYEKVMKERFGKFNIFEMRAGGQSILTSFMNPFLTFGDAFESVCRTSYELPHIQEALKDKYDLVLFSPFFNECLFGLLHQLNTTIVFTTQVPAFPWIAADFGVPNPSSFSPSLFLGYSDKMTLGQRVMNMISGLYVWASLEYVYYPRMEAVYREALKDPKLPSIHEIQKTATLLLENNHVSFYRPKPSMPDVISVGGLFIKPAKELTGELKAFADDATDGLILFSMGSALKGSMMPEKTRKVFLNVFSKLKQRVLWKWETERMDEDLPANVKLSKWLPQPDVLAHKNTKLFITHGGLGSTVEAIYHGVPLIGIPMFGDQNTNMKQAENLGFAAALEFSEIDEAGLGEAIAEVLNKEKYSKTAKERSAIFRDRPELPLDTAVYWVEYALRHPGAPHLRSAARDLSFVQYYSLDVIGILVLSLMSLLLISCWIIKKVVCKVLSLVFGSSKTTSKVKRN